VRPLAEAVTQAEPEIVQYFRRLVDRKIGGVRTRVHGDLHLGQVLHTGRDYSFIDFEGEPARTLSERRLKRSPLIDVAGMLRSFHYAAYATLKQELTSGLVREEDAANLDHWARYWYLWASAYYLKGYLDATAGTHILPREPADVQLLIDAFLLEKAIYEVGYELNNRPTWLSFPLRGVLQLVGKDG
jgi:maltose alpha-D-glucosyltransferase/alpha-amylase